MRTHDISFKSITILENKIESYLQKKCCTLDWGEIPDSKFQTNNILLMGAFYKRIFEFKYWPNGEYFLYVMCSKSRQALIEIFGLPKDSVGLINRYDLFPVASSSKDTWGLFPNTHFVYSGRISPQKNIEFLIFTIFYLQLLYSPSIKLVLFGEFDNEYHHDILGCKYVDYKNKIQSIINNLPWSGEPPVIISNLDEKSWISKIPAIKPMAISTSTLLSEDFSVSMAQFQVNGTPILTPSWGAFHDLRGANIRLFPSSFIATSHEPITAISQKAKVFANLLIEGRISIPSKNMGLLCFTPQKMVSKKLLEESLLKVHLHPHEDPNLQSINSKVRALFSGD